MPHVSSVIAMRTSGRRMDELKSAAMPKVEPFAKIKSAIAVDIVVANSSKGMPLRKLRVFPGKTTSKDSQSRQCRSWHSGVHRSYEQSFHRL